MNVGARGLHVAAHELGGGTRRGLDEVPVPLEIGEAQERRATLPLAEKLARTAQLQVLARDLEAVGALVDHLEPLPRIALQLAVEKDADAFPRSAPDAATQLVQLRKPEALRALDHHERGVGHVDA